jgi:hypothetical protein
MGADSAATDGRGGQQIRRDPKLYKNDPILIGFCGSFRMGQLLGLSLTPPLPRVGQRPENYMVNELIPAIRILFKDQGYSRIENNVEDGGFFLVGFSGRLFKVECDFHVGESDDPYTACGSGEDIALGSLYSTRKEAIPKQRLTKALEAAARYNAGVRPPFIFETL